MAGARRWPIVRVWIHFLAAAMAYVDRQKAANDGKKMLGWLLFALSVAKWRLSGSNFSLQLDAFVHKLPA